MAVSVNHLDWQTCALVTMISLHMCTETNKEYLMEELKSFVHTVRDIIFIQNLFA